MRLGDTNIIPGLLAKRLVVLELFFSREAHGPEALFLWQVLFQRVLWVYGLVYGGSVASGILEDNLLAPWVLLYTLQ